MARIAQPAVVHLPVRQAIFRTVPLTAEQWALVLLVGASVILGGELDKWRNRRRGTPPG